MIGKKERIRFLYNETAPHYNERYVEIQKAKYNAIIEKIQLEGQILDVGGGTGLFSCITELPTDIVDISDELLRIGAQNVDGGNWVAGDGENLPFRKHAYKSVVSFSALQNYPDRKKGMSEILRILCNGGKFAITALSKTLSEEELKSLLEGTDYELVDIPLEDVGAVGKKR